MYVAEVFASQFFITAFSPSQTPLVAHETYDMVRARLSPDGRWVSFTARMKANKAMIAVAPIDGTRPVAESA